MYSLVGVLSAALLCALVCGEKQSEEKKMDVFRLPDNSIPLSYDLWFAPNTSDWTFKGCAKIIVNTINPNIDTLTLNYNNLTVTSLSVTDVSNSESIRDVPYSSINYVPINEQFEIHFNKALIKGRNYQLNINYTGSIRDDMTGLYKSSYVEDGVTK